MRERALVLAVPASLDGILLSMDIWTHSDFFRFSVCPVWRAKQACGSAVWYVSYVQMALQVRA